MTKQSAPWDVRQAAERLAKFLISENHPTTIKDGGDEWGDEWPVILRVIDTDLPMRKDVRANAGDKAFKINLGWHSENVYVGRNNRLNIDELVRFIEYRREFDKAKAEHDEARARYIEMMAEYPDLVTSKSVEHEKVCVYPPRGPHADQSNGSVQLMIHSMNMTIPEATQVLAVIAKIRAGRVTAT